VATMMGGMGRSFDGSYAQYVTVPAGQVIPFETALPWVAARCRRCSRPPTAPSPRASVSRRGRRC
jgi:D-arabinose 1-dehydrogenase-like Zn-dependent alcohol dehydrogenase